MHRYYKFHWLLVEGKEILKQDNGIYYTSNDTYNLEEIKKTVRLSNNLGNDTVITIQNVEEISCEDFEKRM